MQIMFVEITALPFGQQRGTQNSRNAASLVLEELVVDIYQRSRNPESSAPAEFSSHASAH
jgi:hypothetical protein